jgi:hypothetical protein
MLSPRSLSRATLERQLLLRRTTLSALEAVRHLVGMQAQVPLNPYVGLWARLDEFRPEELAQLLVDRKVVRIVAMRSTLHLLTADDALLLRPLAQPALDRELARHPDYGPRLRGGELDVAMSFANVFLAERPRTGGELRAALRDRFPHDDPAALAFACRNLLALVQVPPRGVWGQSAGVVNTTAEAWLGRPVVRDPSVDDVVLRYLAAFGPAAPADAAAWSGLTGMVEVFDRLRPGLRLFRDEGGRELFDLPDAPRPHPGTPAPPRFLPEYDNVLLSHADRSRFGPDDERRRLWPPEQPYQGSVLSDGLLAGTWWIEHDRANGRAVLTIRHLAHLTGTAADAVETDGHGLVRFLYGKDASPEVRFVPVST